MALPEGMRYLVFAGTQAQYFDWCERQNINPRDSSRVVYGASVNRVRGIHGMRPIVTGTFWERSDAEQIWKDAQPAFFSFFERISRPITKQEGPRKEWFPGRWGYSPQLRQLQRFVPGWIVPGAYPEVDLTIDDSDIDGLVTALDEAGLIKPRLDDRLLEAEREHTREAMKLANRLIDKLPTP